MSEDGFIVRTDNLVKGDLVGNAKKIIERIRYLVEHTDETKFVVRSYDIIGGNCGYSLDDHNYFQDFLEEMCNYIEDKAEQIGEEFGKDVFINIDDFDEPDEFITLPYAMDNPRNPFSASPLAIFSLQALGLTNRLKAINCKNVVIGLSGGLDSTLALLVTVQTFEDLKLDKSGIHVYTMPGFGTTKRTLGNAELLCDGLGLKLETISIIDACRQHFKDIGHDENVHDVVFENAQARERTQILMDKANQLKGIVIGTGDMSEIALGWSTYNGDHMSMFGANAGVTKTTVRNVCRWWAENHGGKASEAIFDIIDTPVSPELLPADGDSIVQKTEDKVGPYELHDFFLFYFIEEGFGREEILTKACDVFKGVYDKETIDKWLEVFFKRFFSQAFKRNCMPDGSRVFSVYLSPHDFWVPSDFSPKVFLRESK